MTKTFYLCMKVMLKVILSLHLTKYHAMRTYLRSGGIAHCILNFSTGQRWVVCFTNWPLCTLEKEPLVPIGQVA